MEESDITSPVHILLVDDFEPWRAHIRSALATTPGLQIVGEAADGLAAVELAEQLKPELILLDIGLPGLDGIGVATRISQTTPQSKILFVSANVDVDAARMAIDHGAHGYLLKSDAASQLIPGIQAVLRGESFFSRGIRRSGGEQEHVIQFYADEDSFLDCVSSFVCHALSDGGSAIVAVTKAHLETLNQSLGRRGMDVDHLVESGRYIAMDAAETLPQCMDANLPDEGKVTALMGALIHRAEANHAGLKPVAVFGEMVALLWGARNFEGAIRLEKIWNELARKLYLRLHCVYPSSICSPAQSDGLYAAVCAEHSSVLPSQTRDVRSENV